jgi:hypothetical protein
MGKGTRLSRGWGRREKVMREMSELSSIVDTLVYSVVIYVSSCTQEKNET